MKSNDAKQAIAGETAAVIGRPIALVPAAVLVGLVLDWLAPLPLTVPGGDFVGWAGVLLIIIGLAFFVAGVRNFSRADTPLPTNQPARVLVSTGVHRWTRNPIYLGFLLAFFGIGLVTGSPWILILALPLAVYLRYGVIAREEAYLERRFGDSYREYKTRVRRWL